MIEHGHIDRLDPVLTGAVERALAPLRGKALDAVLLGCTHYGIIEDAIRDSLGDVPLLSAAECGAQALQKRLEAEGLCAENGAGTVRFFVSCDAADFNAFASNYLDLGPVHAEQVAPMEL